MDRLNYHTSITQVKPAIPFEDLLKQFRLDYHTNITSERALKENLIKLNPALDDNNIYTLAYLCSHPIVDEVKREEYKTKLTKQINEYNNVANEVCSTLCKVD